MRHNSSFELFWETYPRKRAKWSAQVAWNKMHPDPVLISQIMVAVETQKRSRQWQINDGQYIPSPVSWLRGGRWLDDVGPEMTTPGAWKDMCDHEPSCSNATNCQNLKDIAAYKAAQRTT